MSAGIICWAKSGSLLVIRVDLLSNGFIAHLYSALLVINKYDRQFPLIIHDIFIWIVRSTIYIYIGDISLGFKIVLHKTVISLQEYLCGAILFHRFNFVVSLSVVHHHVDESRDTSKCLSNHACPCTVYWKGIYITYAYHNKIHWH